MSKDQALKQWELENAVELVDSTRDALYSLPDATKIKAMNDAKPWKQNPNYFKNVRISAVALLKMVMHARSGGSIEVMGLMLGYVDGDTFVVTDAFRLPVEGTETRVNAHAEADEYMVQFTNFSREAGQLENAVGWYHSHPGYGCWLSGIDVTTEHTHQAFNDPFVAVVIDPDRTISAGKVEIGAFRTYPENYKPEGAQSDGYQTVPLAKIEDFGAHSSRYYSLDVSHYKSSLDSKILESLWNKYWVGTLSSSPLFTNRDYGTNQIKDLAAKIADCQSVSSSKNPGWGPVRPAGASRTTDSQLDKIIRASKKIDAEEKTGLLAAEVKDKVFTISNRQVDTEMKA
jgi:COP9 signalosome complex subunit 5